MIEWKSICEGGSNGFRKFCVIGKLETKERGKQGIEQTDLFINWPDLKLSKKLFNFYQQDLLLSCKLKVHTQIYTSSLYSSTQVYTSSLYSSIYTSTQVYTQVLNYIPKYLRLYQGLKSVPKFILQVYTQVLKSVPKSKV